MIDFEDRLKLKAPASRLYNMCQGSPAWDQIRESIREADEVVDRLRIFDEGRLLTAIDQSIAECRVRLEESESAKQAFKKYPEWTKIMEEFAAAVALTLCEKV